MGKKFDIFISYRRDGGIDSAVALKSTLNQMHYRAFLDVDSLRSGPFDTALLRHIEECKDFLLVLSPNALARCVNEDDWVRREIEHAMALGKNIIPIICDGGSVQERMNVPLPESLADLPRYNVLEANLVQLRAMTQLLRTTLTAQPHNPVKGMAIGASIAVVLCVIAFFAAGFVQDYLNTYPRTAKEKNLVEQAIAQQSMNLVQYDVAHAAYLKALDKTTLYLSGSPQVSRSELSQEYGFVLDTLEACSKTIADVEPQVAQGLASSPISVADMTAQSGYLRDCLDQMYSVMLFLEYEFLDDEYTPTTSKSLWVACYRDLAVLEGDTVVLGLNELFLPVSEEALRDLRTVSLPLLTSIYTGQTWVSTKDDADMRSKSLFERQNEIIDKYGNDLLNSEAMRENERKLNAIREQLLTEQLPAIREQLRQQRNEVAQLQAQLYDKYRPKETDSADELFLKGVRFMRNDMITPAIEAFAMYGRSDAPNAKAVADAGAYFAIYRSMTGIHHGLVVTMYADGAPPQPEIQIGDIIYAVNGKEVAYLEDYIAAKDGNAGSNVYVLRFQNGGYERLSIDLDPNASLLHLLVLEYE